MGFNNSKIKMYINKRHVQKVNCMEWLQTRELYLTYTAN